MTSLIGLAQTYSTIPFHPLPFAGNIKDHEVFHDMWHVEWEHDHGYIFDTARRGLYSIGIVWYPGDAKSPDINSYDIGLVLQGPLLLAWINIIPSIDK